MVAYPRCLLMPLLAASIARISTKALTATQYRILPFPEPSHDAKCGLVTFVKIDGGWFFSERRLYVDWMEERALS
jgi:hypothetical protein